MDKADRALNKWLKTSQAQDERKNELSTDFLRQSTLLYVSSNNNQRFPTNDSQKPKLFAKTKF